MILKYKHLFFYFLNDSSTKIKDYTLYFIRKKHLKVLFFISLSIPNINRNIYYNVAVGI